MITNLAFIRARAEEQARQHETADVCNPYPSGDPAHDAFRDEFDQARARVKISRLAAEEALEVAP